MDEEAVGFAGRLGLQHRLIDFAVHGGDNVGAFLGGNGLAQPLQQGPEGGQGGGPGSGAPGGAPDAGAPAQDGRSSAADLSRPRGGEAGGGEGPSSSSAKPALDPRAAAVQAAREAARGRGPRPEPTPQAAEKPSVSWEDEVASDDDISLEESGLVGRAVVERILGARLIEELPNS